MRPTGYRYCPASDVDEGGNAVIHMSWKRSIHRWMAGMAVAATIVVTILTSAVAAPDAAPGVAAPVSAAAAAAASSDSGMSAPVGAAVATVASSDSGTSAGRPGHVGRQSDNSTTVTARYAHGAATFTVHGASGRSYDVDLSATGGVAPDTDSLSVTAGRSGVATFEVPVSVGTSRQGSLTAVLAFGDDSTPLQSSGSLWLEPTADGGVAQGTSQIEAEVTAIKRFVLGP